MTEAKDILGDHPDGKSFGCYTKAEDGHTNNNTPHRSLVQAHNDWNKTVKQLRKSLIKHHISDKMMAQDLRKLKNLRVLGYPVDDGNIHRFPVADKTRKGNLAEVFLAEYICSATNADIPIYRLRYNPNVEQAMKGDDVLAFDFNSSRPRIIVGESKFRGTPSKQAVEDIVSGLIRSYQAGLPSSLQFVADRLYEDEDFELANRISDCSLQMAKGRLDLHYVGLLMSNHNSKTNIDNHTSQNLRNLVMFSFGLKNPSRFVADCYEGLQAETYDNP